VRGVRSGVEILRDAKTIAIVGASPDPRRPSHGVMAYLLRAGYDVVPVNPTAGGEVLGVPCVARLSELERPVDLVDVFRRAEHCADVAQEAAEIGAGALWLQLGLRSSEARRIAEEAGMDYVEDACTAVVHRRI
jgi:predicted CoA-binding protein